MLQKKKGKLVLMKKMAQQEARREPFHFFKVILERTLREKKLKIPENFVRRFGDELSTVVNIKVPNGRVWQVGMTKDESKIWFDDGWDDFVNYHSICVGYFLVFKYAKNSTFGVHIFDTTTTCEIDYPYNFVEPKMEEQSTGTVSGDEIECNHSVKILGSRTRSKKAMYNSEGSSHHKRRLNETMENFRTPSPSVQDKHQTEVVDGDEMLDFLEEMGIYIVRSCRHLAAQERRRAISAARLMKPKNPSFMHVIQANERRRGYLFIPAKFTKNLSTIPKFIKLQVSDGREWSIRTRFKHARRLGLCLYHGWVGFAGEMNLDRKDICIFELIKMEDVILKVSIFRAR